MLINMSAVFCGKYSVRRIAPQWQEGPQMCLQWSCPCLPFYHLLRQMHHQVLLWPRRVHFREDQEPRWGMGWSVSLLEIFIYHIA